jgi:serine/threonine protein kinase
LVRSAVDWKNNRKIAVKVYNKSELDLDEKLNIEREIEILKSINHKNVTSLYDVFETPKTVTNFLFR